MLIFTSLMITSAISAIFVSELDLPLTHTSRPALELARLSYTVSISAASRMRTVTSGRSDPMTEHLRFRNLKE